MSVICWSNIHPSFLTWMVAGWHLCAHVHCDRKTANAGQPCEPMRTANLSWHWGSLHRITVWLFRISSEFNRPSCACNYSHHLKLQRPCYHCFNVSSELCNGGMITWMPNTRHHLWLVGDAKLLVTFPRSESKQTSWGCRHHFPTAIHPFFLIQSIWVLTGNFLIQSIWVLLRGFQVGSIYSLKHCPLL